MSVPPPYRALVWDTSVWIAVLNDEPDVEPLPEEAADLPLLVTPIVLAEVTALARRGRIRGGDAARILQEAATYEPLTREDAIAGGEQYARLRAAGHRKVSLGDCLVYATARRVDALLVTADADLRDEPHVRLVRTASRRRR